MRNKKRGMKPEDLFKMRFVRSIAISPNEEEIVYSVEWIDKDKKKYYSNLWLIPSNGGVSRQLTFGKVKDRSPCWSPDGKAIAFLSTRDEKERIYILPRDGGEARKLVEMEGTFASLSYSPDGKLLLCAFRKKDSLPEKDGKKEAPVFRHITRLFYRLDGAGFMPKDGFHLWTFDVETGKGKQITKGKYDELSPTFSPDGRRIAFISNRSGDPDRNPLRVDLWLVPKGGGRFTRVPTPPGPVDGPAWSPDGKRIAYMGHTNPEDAWGVTNYHLWVVPTGGRGRARDLLPRFDRSVIDLTISDTIEFSEGASRPLWSKDGKTLYFHASDKGNTHLFSISSSGGAIRRIVDGHLQVMGYNGAGSGKKLALLIADSTGPGDVWLTPLNQRGRAKPKRLTTVNQSLFNEVALSPPREIRYRSFDGTVIQGWIIRPFGFKKGRKYPTVVEIHGGPRAQYGNVFFHEFQCLASKGYTIFYTNPRGSQGFGESFAGAIVKDWGNLDYKDIMAGVEWLEKRDFVDTKRIGVTGGSYGGYMTNWIVGHTNRFKAAVTQRSVTNLVSFFGSSDFGYDDYREFGGHPWEKFEELVRMSPITYVQKIRTPLLIIHSEQDLRCPIEQAEQLFAALKVLRRKVEFIRFPEEPHGLSRCGRPDRRIERLN
ncbi:S9 family peptidase, partial [candidate division TA06 bacterium]|nr:S9 family peptidase [candidate division TA06 bacterium]